MGMPKETSLGGIGGAFPSTRWTLVVHAKEAASPERREAVDALCRLYWKPVYAYLRSHRALGNEEAKDLTQEFFVEILEGDLLERYSADRGSFRNYVKGALRLFLLKRHEIASALKRGAGRMRWSLDAGEMERIDVPTDAAPEESFDREWARSVLDHAVADLKEDLAVSNRAHYYSVFERHELAAGGAPPSYSDVARDLGLKETDVTNYLYYCRRRLRTLVLARVRDYVDRDGDVPAELSRIFTKLSDARG